MLYDKGKGKAYKRLIVIRNSKHEFEEMGFSYGPFKAKKVKVRTLMNNVT